jgi:hypothetical protein
MGIVKYSRSLKVKKNPLEQKNGRKKTYHSPKLTSFGGIANLTQQNSRSNASDAGNNLMAVASF